MAEEEDIRELIGRMSAAQRQGFHVTPAHIRLILAGLRFYLAARTWLARPRADPHDDAPRKRPEPYTGKLPTIGDSRKYGMVACHIHCGGPNCYRQKRITFDELGLPDETVFVDIVRLRSFRCQKCGSRRVSVSPDWTDIPASGNGRRRAPDAVQP